MREIKFRGKNEQGWHYGLLTFMFGSYAISHVEDENTVDLVDEKTVGQYTGLKDKNGVEIYEEEKDYLMADEVDEDECVKLVSIEIPDELIIDLEDETSEEKIAMLIHDPNRSDEDPREDGWDSDYYAAWSDDVKKRREAEK